MGGIDMKYRIAYIREEYYSYVIQRSILWGLFWMTWIHTSTAGRRRRLWR